MSHDYLFDPSDPPDAEIEALERALQPARFDAAARPLPLTLTPKHRSRAKWLAAAAAIVLLAGGVAAWTSWRLTWSDGRPWTMRVDRTARALAPRTPYAVPQGTSADIEIARIGRMEASGGSVLSVTETRASRHRVRLDVGSVSVRVWAPPARLAFMTPAGEVIDLGCVFDLTVDRAGAAHVVVRTGWVQVANAAGEMLVPAGTETTMTAGARPAVPVYVDAAPPLAAAIRAFEASPFDPARVDALHAALRFARPRDVLTLLMLAYTAPPAVARPLLDRAAALVPPPADVRIDDIVAGSSRQLWEWYDSLDLPPAKNWWRNWRDALPLHLDGDR